MSPQLDFLILSDNLEYRQYVHLSPTHVARASRDSIALDHHPDKLRYCKAGCPSDFGEGYGAAFGGRRSTR